MKNRTPFSPHKSTAVQPQASMAYGFLKTPPPEQRRVADSMWLSKKMVDDGCTLEQTFQTMNERCKICDELSPMVCVDQCDTWKVKRELRKIDRLLSKDDHRLKLLNALKNERRLKILHILRKRTLSVDGLQGELRKSCLYHSKKTINEYLNPMLEAGLVSKKGGCFMLTLYGRKVHDAVVRHEFVGHLPIHSRGYEEIVLRKLLDGGKTRGELAEAGLAKSLSRVLKRLVDSKLISNNSPSARIFYFRTKRALSMEHVSPTQRTICEVIPQAGIPARALAETTGISLRRTYKNLRNLRGKKLVFRREVPVKYELTTRGRAVAKFLEEIAEVE